MIWNGIYRQASWVSGSAFGRQFYVLSHVPKNAGAISGLTKSPEIQTHLQSSFLLNRGMKPGLVRGAAQNVSLSFRSFLHFGERTEFGEWLNGAKGTGRTPTSMSYYQSLLQGSSVNGGPPFHQPEVGAGGMIPRPTDDVQGTFRDRGNGLREGSGFYHQQQLESNADIVHIKLMRNNSYVTLTDDKGNRKLSVSAGQVAAKGDKPGRYLGEAAAEYMGRAVKNMKIRSVVVKVSGFTFFRRKKDAILAFKDGYTHSRGDVNPVVYIEDTTRKPHNGCRLPKSRRI